MDKYQARQIEKFNLIKGIKNDIKEMLNDLGYTNCKYANFTLTCKPDRFTKVGTLNSTLFLVDNNGMEYHEDNINDVDELLTILRAMHHILPNR